MVNGIRIAITTAVIATALVHLTESIDEGDITHDLEVLIGGETIINIDNGEQTEAIPLQNANVTQNAEEIETTAIADIDLQISLHSHLQNELWKLHILSVQYGPYLIYAPILHTQDIGL